MPETLELTFAGLCVLVVKGPANTTNPDSVKLLMVDDMMHKPRLSFRGIDLATVSSGDTDLVPIQIAPDGQELIDIPIPAASAISVVWEAGPHDTQNSMIWDGSGPSMQRVPDLRDFNVATIHLDGLGASASVTLPLGRFEARRTARKRDKELKWSFEDGVDIHFYANQVTLVSTADLGSILRVSLGGKNFRFLSGDGELPLRIGLTNLPSAEHLIEGPLHPGESPDHLKAYQKIALTEIEPGFRVFHLRGEGATRQGTICPVVRGHV